MDKTHFMTEDLVREVVGTFNWPATYTVEEDLPDGVTVQFPNCALYFVESYDGDVSLEFLPEDTGTDVPLELGHAMMVALPVESRDGRPLATGLFDDYSPDGSVEKVRHGIHDLCAVVLAHLKHVILGDFSWVAMYEAMR